MPLQGHRRYSQAVELKSDRQYQNFQIQKTNHSNFEAFNKSLKEEETFESKAGLS